MEEKLPVFEPYLFGDEWRRVKHALDERSLSGTSPVVREFEEALRRLSGTRYAVAVSSGTAALHLALLALEVRPGEEIIVPDSTIVSDALAVVLCGAVPVFADVSPRDWCLEPDEVERLLSPRTVGILAVHLYGQACDLDRLSEIGRRHHLWLVEDAAQAQGGTWRGRPLGSHGRAGCYSFYANKLVTTGEGGALVTDDEALAARARRLRNLSFSDDPSRRFVHEELSHNYRLGGLAAALGLGQLDHLDELGRLRERVRSYYLTAMDEPRRYSLPEADPRCTPAFWMMAILLDEEVRWTVPDLQGALLEKGIETRRFFHPLHAQPALRGYHPYENRRYPVSERLFRRGIYLPSSSRLTYDEVERVVRTLHGLLAADRDR